MGFIKTKRAFWNTVDWNDLEDDAFSKTGALTIKSSSSSSGGLAGALGKWHNACVETNRTFIVLKYDTEILIIVFFLKFRH